MLSKNYLLLILGEVITIINTVNSKLNYSKSKIFNLWSELTIMADNNIFAFLQQGLRTVVGATAEAIETLQDTQKRNQAISELNQEWQKKSQEC